MAQSIETYYVLQDRIDAASWEVLSSTMVAFADWPNEDPVFVYTEALDDCKLERCRADQALERVAQCAPSGPASLLQGRIFNSSVEARWQRLPHGRWAAWTIREAPNPPQAANNASASSSRNARRILRWHYLLGKRHRIGNRLHDARYTKCFDYPVEGAQPDDRAYIEVAEYLHVEPEWPRDFPENDEAAVESTQSINSALSKPLLFAHRFVSVGIGTGRKED